MAAAQDAFDDLRDRLVLINAELAASPKQGQARLQSDFVAGFINGAGQAFEAGDHAVQDTQRFARGHAQAAKGGGCGATVQTEAGVLAEHLFSGNVAVGAGEFHSIVEWLAQAFCALEGQDVERLVNIANSERVPTMVEETLGNPLEAIPFTPRRESPKSKRFGLGD